jgi:mannose-6-phosphate isomerase-like protein (cupin superfamily)
MELVVVNPPPPLEETGPMISDSLNYAASGVHASESCAKPGANAYTIVDFDQLAPVACPCGQARRAFLDVPEFPGTIHRTEITAEAKTHYHNRLTETYYILECGPDAKMYLDGNLVPVRPGVCILIPPGVRHRAVGRMTVLIVVFPKFDPHDEVLVD